MEMKKWIGLIILILALAGCSSRGGAVPPREPEWRYILSPAGKCYEYTNWYNGYAGYTISGQVELHHCK